MAKVAFSDWYAKFHSEIPWYAAISQHYLWLESKGDEGQQLDLSNSHFSFVDFREVDYLIGVNFRASTFYGCNMENHRFRRSDFTNCNFNRCDMGNAHFYRARLEGVDFITCQMSHARLGRAVGQIRLVANSNLRGAVFEGGVAANIRTMQFNYGSGMHIRHVSTDKYEVAYTDTHMQIGCEFHLLDDWWAFSDKDIARMDHGAVEWWGRWKPVLQALVNVNPAAESLPHGEDYYPFSAQKDEEVRVRLSGPRIHGFKKS